MFAAASTSYVLKLAGVSRLRCQSENFKMTVPFGQLDDVGPTCAVRFSFRDHQ